MAEFPFSDELVLDESQPTDSTLGLSLDDRMRETRRAVNWIYQRTGARHFRHHDLVPFVQEVSVLGDKFVEFDMTETPHTLVRLTGGYDGQIIYCLLAESDPPNTLIWHHNDSYIKLKDGRDFHMLPGDLLCLRNVGGDLEGEEGHWEELFREINGAILGLISPGRSRFQVTVTDEGALQVEDL